MDALVKLLIDEYKMSPDEASKYAAIIHDRAANPTGAGKGIDSEYGNPDHLQTQAYDKVAKDEITNMDRLRKRALFFTNIARARANGHVLSPDAEQYYQQVMDLHKKSVAQHGRDTIQQYGKTQQYLANRQHEVDLGPVRAELGGQDIRNKASQLTQQYSAQENSTLGGPGIDIGDVTVTSLPRRK